MLMAVSVMYYGILCARGEENMGSGFWVLGSGRDSGQRCGLAEPGFTGFKDPQDDEASGFQTPPTIVFWREENGQLPSHWG